MRKLLAVLVLGMFLLAPQAHAYYCAPAVPLATSTAGNGGAAFFPFAGAVGLMLAVIYLNAEGVPFPLCGVDGAKCYPQYPSDKNGG